MLEKEFQNFVIHLCKQRELMYWKLAITGRRGIPDLMIIGPGATLLFLELKTSTGRPSAMQKLVVKKLRAFDFHAHIVSGKTEARVIIDTIFCT